MMKRFIYAAAAVAVALIVQGCSGMQWAKPGADAAAIARDQDDCRARALGRAMQQDGAGRPESRESGRPIGMAANQGSNERFIAEHEETSRCMLQRGYELRRPG